MAANPNPSRITSPMWMLWERCRGAIPGVLLGGIYADKSGYHNTVDRNRSRWPGNYSIRLSIDLRAPTNKARAIDLTMSGAQMRQRTTYVERSAKDSRDNRLAAVREVYGTLNGRQVFGIIKDSRNGSWRSSSADSTHLWHIHISIFTPYVDDWSELEPILSVLSGETLAQWNARKSGGTGIMLPRKGDGAANGMDEIVKFYQRRLDRLGFEPGPFDGEYGDSTQGAVTRSRAAYGYGNPEAPKITGTHAERMDAEVAALYAGKDGKAGDRGPGPTAAQIATAVGNWMAQFKDTLKPTAAEVEAFVIGWVEAHKEELRGPAGKTPTMVAIRGDVIEAI